MCCLTDRSTTLPALLQLVLEDVDWQGSLLRAGGLWGVFLLDQMGGYIGFVGSLFLLLTAVVVGWSLIVQSSLGEILAAWAARVRSVREDAGMRRTRSRQQKEKDRARKRVVDKHLRRGRGKVTVSAEPEPGRSDPARVVERHGQGSFSLRRVRAPSGLESVEPSPQRAKKKKPQKTLDFGSGAKRGSALPPLNLLCQDEELEPVRDQP